MSAPDTNLEQQKSDHKPSLIGIKGAMIFGLLMLACAVAYAVNNGQSPTAETMYSTQSERWVETSEKGKPYHSSTNTSN